MNKILNVGRHLLHDKRAVSVFEYGLIGGLVFSIVLAGATTMVNSYTQVMQNVSTVLNAGPGAPRGNEGGD